MVRLTLIARASDGLPLVESLDAEKGPELDQYKLQAKGLFKKIAAEKTAAEPLCMSLQSGGCQFHCLVKAGVAYVTLAAQAYPKKLAFQYLNELQKEFMNLYGPQIETANRPYAFIKFDTFIQKTKKLYLDPGRQPNLVALNQELAEVHQIMCANMQDVLKQGEKLSDMLRISSTLADESRKYSRKASTLYNQALLQKYLPVVIIIGIVLFVLFFRSLYR